MLKLVFNIDPIPASRPRVSRYATYYKEPYAQFRKDMGKLILQYPKTLLDGPLQTAVTFYRLIPKSFSKKKREAMHGTWFISNVDLDNLEKALYDALNEYVYVDDSQIVWHSTRKIWAKENPRIEMELKQL